jgi:hypothetical protein
VSVELFSVGAGGSKDPVIPEGPLFKLKVIGPVKLVRPMPTLIVPLHPCEIVSVAGVSGSV